jgi:hypothetical protein
MPSGIEALALAGPMAAAVNGPPHAWASALTSSVPLLVMVAEARPVPLTNAFCEMAVESVAVAEAVPGKVPITCACASAFIPRDPSLVSDTLALPAPVAEADWLMAELSCALA